MGEFIPGPRTRTGLGNWSASANVIFLLLFFACLAASAGVAANVPSGSALPASAPENVLPSLSLSLALTGPAPEQSAREMVPADGVQGVPVVSQKQFQIPVLKNRRDNPVLRIRISVPAGSSLQAGEFLLNTAGSSEIGELKALRIYYTGKDSLPGTLAEAELFGSASRVKKKTKISGTHELQAGTHFFWVSLELEPDADLDHMVRVLCDGVHTSQGLIRAAQAAAPLSMRLGVAVRKHMQDEVHTSRIPGLATTREGTLLAIFDARYESARDLQGHMDIGLHRSTDGGNTWEPLRIVLDQGTWGGLPEKYNGVSDASILIDENSGDIYIAGLWMHGVLDPEDGSWIENLSENSTEWNHQWRNKASQPGHGVKQTSQFLLTKSTDDGKTWSKAVNLTASIKPESWWLLAPAPGRGITLDDGTLVFPGQGRDEKGRGFSTVVYSRDGGKTWKTGNPALDISTTECAVVQLSDGSLMLNMRSGRNKGRTGPDNGRGIAISRDLGKTWTEHPGSFRDLPEPTCMASLHEHRFDEKGNGRSVLVFSNPNSKTERKNMSLKFSFDDGRSWPEDHYILLDEWKGRGYSCLTSMGDSHIGILYESSQADLIFQRINVESLQNTKE